MKKYVLALDEGTTSVRSILFDRDGRIVASAQKEFSLFYPQPGWVEMNPTEVYASQYATMTEAVIDAGIAPDEIAAIGIANQRETTVVWDKTTGTPIYNAIVWQCRRTADTCEELRASGMGDYIREHTGLLIDAYFSGTKIKWILDHVEGARAKAERGELLFGTVDTWLLWKLTGGRVHVTDRTNASRTMLFDLYTLDWDQTILSALSIPRMMLPEVKSSGEIFAEINLFDATIPVSGIAGDQQAALFGQRCFGEGDAKNTYGTGCFLLMNTGEKPCIGREGLLATIAATEKEMPVNYAVEGSVFVGGAVISWLRDELDFIRESGDSEYFATKVKNSGGVYVVPAFAGLGAPYWDMYARGAIVGLTRGSNRNHIIRAAVESIAYQTEDVLQAMQRDTGQTLRTLKVDGGASANNFLMQFQADISSVRVERGHDVESTALGAAYLAGLAVGFWKTRAELCSSDNAGRVFLPKMTEEERQMLLSGWKRAVDTTRGWAK